MSHFGIGAISKEFSDPKVQYGTVPGDLLNPTEIEALIGEFQVYLRNVKRKSYKTALDRATYLRRFMRHFMKPLETITTNEIAIFLGRFNGSSTRDHYLKALKLAYKWRDLGDRVKEFSFEPNDVKPKVIPSDEEVRMFFYALQDDRAKALYLCYASSGKRKMEVLTLKRS
ncbi:MAG: hypothetical protein QW220_07060 [Candidatus Bathyarchaeia archaeon]